MEATRHDTNRISGYIFGPFFTFYLFSTILPAILLNVYIRNRIKDYDLGSKCVYTWYYQVNKLC